MNAIAKHAAALVGVPFRHQGRNPAIGLDCIGVWVAALRGAGVAVQDSTAYRRYPSAKVLRAQMSAQFRRVQRAEPGDALAIRVPRHSEARHLGVYIGDGRMVHAEAQAGRVTISRVVWDHVEAIYRVRAD